MATNYDLGKILADLNCWCIQNNAAIPSMYYNTLSMTEKVSKLFYVVKTVTESQVEVTGDFQELYNFVHDYFDNLDVQTEINNKINSMITDGSLSQIIMPLVTEYQLPEIVSSTDLMKDDKKLYILSSNGHLYYPQNETFIDSGIVYTQANNSVISSGILIDETNYMNYPDANSFSQNMIYAISSNITADMVSNLPYYGRTAIVYNSGYKGLDNPAGFIQSYFNEYGQSFFRMKTDSDFSTWFNDLQSSGTIPSRIKDANELPANQIFSFSSSTSEESLKNLPKYGKSGIIYTLTGSFVGGGFSQLVCYSDGTIYQRYGTSSRNFTSWISGLMPGGLATDFSANADTLPINSVVAISSSTTESQISNLPIYGVGAIIYTLCNEIEGGNKVQFIIYNSGQMFRRYATSSGFGHWVNFDNCPVNFVNTCVDKPIEITSQTKIAIFGDSISTDTHGGFTWGSLLADKFSCMVTSYAVGSAVFDNSNPNNIITQINNVSSWENVNIIFVAAGVNDCRLNTTPENFKNSVLETITTLKQKAPTAKIIYITPIRYQGTTQDNLLDYSGAICNLAVTNGCSVINGFDFPIQTYTTDWADEITDDDGLHPNTDGKHVYAQSVLNAIL